MVEAGTSAYYTMLKDSSDEPVFKSICAKIAADELRHATAVILHDFKSLSGRKIPTSVAFKAAADFIQAGFPKAKMTNSPMPIMPPIATSTGEYDHKFFKNLCFATLLQV